ncbi:MAG: nucleotide-binding domain containing protein [Devosia sp.]
MGLPENFRRQGRIGALAVAERLVAPKGKPIVLAGCCSNSTLAQVQGAIEAGRSAMKIVPADVAAGVQTVADVANWVLKHTGKHAALVYSSDKPEPAEGARKPLHEADARLVVEQLMANLAVILRDNGFSRFIVAGDQVGAAVVAALGVLAIEIGPQISPGVHWCRCIGRPDLALALKPEDIGAEDFFTSAWDLLDD